MSAVNILIYHSIIFCLSFESTIIRKEILFRKRERVVKMHILCFFCFIMSTTIYGIFYTYNILDCM